MRLLSQPILPETEVEETQAPAAALNGPRRLAGRHIGPMTGRGWE